MAQTKRLRERMQPGQKIVEEEWSEMATKLIIGNYGVVPYSFCIVSLLFKPIKRISEKNFFGGSCASVKLSAIETLAQVSQDLNSNIINCLGQFWPISLANSVIHVFMIGEITKVFQAIIR